MTEGFAFSSAHPFFLLPSPAIPLYHSCCEVVCLNPVRPFWTCHLFFSQWPSTAIGSFITSLASSFVPFVFSWASLAYFLSLSFLGPFLNSTFSWVFTEFFRLPQLHYPSSLGLMGLSLSLTFFAFITLNLPQPILTFPHHIPVGVYALKSNLLACHK